MQFYFTDAMKILAKTIPYVLLRLAVYGFIGLAVAAYLGLVAGIAKVFGSGGAFVFLIGLAILAGLLRLLKHYVLYLINAGHIAVITELIETGLLPPGINQFQYGKQMVTRIFQEVSAMFLLDQLVEGTLRAFSRTIAGLTDLLPVPGLGGLTRIINGVVYFSLTFVDETILSYNLARRDENFWEGARRGAILYAQNWQPILTTAAACTVANFVGFVALFLLLLIPFAPMAMMSHSETLKLFWLVLAFAIAYGIKLALFNPFFQASMILTFRSATVGQQPNAEWESNLAMASEKFRELQKKAADFVHSGRPCRSSRPNEKSTV